ncbi:type II secretion system protein GspM [Acinetobacter sp. WZC-1]|uniref:type II secretion system protein GspM n=1 Tax=Acinetobacter sp. WZC-1 TaxID=3459034 RepID=UPI00403D9E70
MKALDKFQTKMDDRIGQVLVQLEKMSARERIMVIFTTVFVVVAAIGSALWYMHAAAEKQQNRLNGLKDLVVWMQSNVVAMKPTDDPAMTTADKVQRAAQRQELAVAVSQQADKQMQIVAQHENYAVLANFLTQLAQAGISIQKMELSKADGKVKLTATVQ